MVLRSQADDREALGSLLQSVQAALFRYIAHLVGPDAADDVLQDVFLEICRHIRALHEPEFFRAWAYRIATRASFSCIQRRRLWLTRHDEEVELDALPAGGEADKALLAHEIQPLLEWASPASRAILALHYLEGLTIHEVAAVLQLSEGTVKSRLAYGLNSLRRATGRKGNSDDRSI